MLGLIEPVNAHMYVTRAAGSSPNKVVPNIRRADISENKGWVVLELEGGEKDIEAAIDWLTSKGIRVDPATGDIVEG